MADLMRDAAEWLADQIGNSAVHTVTYRSGGASFQLQAAIGRTAMLTDMGAVVADDFEARDYLVKSADLQALPVPGDQIIDTVNGQSVVFAVLADAGQRCWRYSDAFGVRMRIHTKRVAVE